MPKRRVYAPVSSIDLSNRSWSNPNKRVRTKLPVHAILQNADYGMSANYNYQRSYNKKRKRKRRGRSFKPSKKMMKYIKNQIAKPDWSGTFQKRDIGMASRDSALNKVEYGSMSNCCFDTTANLTSLFDGSSSLSFKSIDTGAQTAGVVMDAISTLMLNKKVRTRHDVSFRLKNMTNASFYLEIGVWTAKCGTNETPLTQMDSAYDKVSGNTALAKEDDHFIDSMKQLVGTGGDWSLSKLRAVHLNAGESSSMSFHSKWKVFDFDNLRQHGDTAFSYVKGTEMFTYRIRGAYTHGSTTITQFGITPAEVVYAYENKEYAQWLEKDAATNVKNLTVNALTAIDADVANAQDAHHAAYAD